MKKFMTILLVGMMTLGLIGCGSAESSEANGAASGENTRESPAPTICRADS